MTVIWKAKSLKKTKIETVQVNIGNRCNQSCVHCHIGASPRGENNMDRTTAGRILDKILEMSFDNIEFTGGASPNHHLSLNLTAHMSLKKINPKEYAAIQP